MTETRFEVGKQYRTRAGQIRTIEHIDLNNDSFPIWAKGAGTRWSHTANGSYFASGHPSDYDLLLPAIEAEGTPAPIEPEPQVIFGEPARATLEAFADAWEDFRRGVLYEKLLPGYGGVAVCGKMGLPINCTYPSKDVALDEASAVIAAINSLLEGGAK